MVLIYRHLLEEGLKESADILGRYTCTLAPHSPTRCSNYLIWGGITEPTWILEQQLNILILVMIHVQVWKICPLKMYTLIFANIICLYIFLCKIIPHRTFPVFRIGCEILWSSYDYQTKLNLKVTRFCCFRIYNYPFCFHWKNRDYNSFSVKKR